MKGGFTEEHDYDIKPVLGIMPKQIWDARRIEDIAQAITRYLQAHMRIPEEWIKEYNELLNNK